MRPTQRPENGMRAVDAEQDDAYLAGSNLDRRDIVEGHARIDLGRFEVEVQRSVPAQKGDQDGGFYRLQLGERRRFPLASVLLPGEVGRRPRLGNHFVT